MTELLQILYKRQWYILEGSEAGKEKLNRKDLLSVSMSGVREGEEPKCDTIFFFLQAIKIVKSSLTSNRNTLERAHWVG